MDTTPTSSPDGERTCPVCGAAFTCAVAAGKDRCWCFDLPNIVPLTHIDRGGCLCPACLQQQIEAMTVHNPISAGHEHYSQTEKFE